MLRLVNNFLHKIFELKNWTTIMNNRMLGYLDCCHCNFSTFEKWHYNSSIQNRAIIISSLSEISHCVHSLRHWVHLQSTVFSYCPKYPSIFLNVHVTYMWALSVNFFLLFFFRPAVRFPTAPNTVRAMCEGWHLPPRGWRWCAGELLDAVHDGPATRQEASAELGGVEVVDATG
jgi:hypothetical protein